MEEEECKRQDQRRAALEANPLQNKTPKHVAGSFKIRGIQLNFGFSLIASVLVSAHRTKRLLASKTDKRQISDLHCFKSWRAESKLSETRRLPEIPTSLARTCTRTGSRVLPPAPALYHSRHIKAQHIWDKQCHRQSHLGRVPKSIPHTLPGLSTDDLIDSAQSSDLQTNRLSQLETGVTATKPELSGDDKSLLRATDVSRNDGRLAAEIAPACPTSHFSRREKKVGSWRRSGNGSPLPLLIAALKINFRDSVGAAGAAGAGLPAVGEKGDEKCFQGDS